MSVPISVARGMVRCGMLDARGGNRSAFEAEHRPKGQGRGGRDPFGLTGVGANSAGRSPWPRTISAITMAAISGMILSTLVKIWTLPATRAPVQATAVNKATKPIAESARNGRRGKEARCERAQDS